MKVKKQLKTAALLLAVFTASVLFLTGCPAEPDSGKGPDNTASKTQLNTEITKAQNFLKGVAVSEDGSDVATTEDWISPANEKKLQDAITAARNVANKTSATANEMDEARKKLSGVLTEVSNSKQKGTSTNAVDKTDLNKKINDAKTKMNGVVVRANASEAFTYEKWVTQAVWDALKTALENAESVNNNASATKAQVDEALTNLTGPYDAFVPAAGTKQEVKVTAQTVNEAADTSTLKLALTFETTVTATDPKAGFTIKTAAFNFAIASAAIVDKVITFTLADNTPVLSTDTGITLSYAGGSLKFASGDVPDFSDTAVVNNVKVGFHIAKAAVVPDTPNIIRVTFTQPAKMDSGKLSAFTVKVNDRPATRIAQFSNNTAPMLDMFSMTTRTISSAAAVSPSGEYALTWNLTVNAPAKHGEIIRLALNDPSVATYTGPRGGGGLSGISAENNPASPATGTVMVSSPMQEFIVQNLVPRGGFVPTAAGFYEGNTNKTSSLASGTDETLYQRAITWLATPANQTDGAVYTIALGTNQTYAGGVGTFTVAQKPGATGGTSAYSPLSFTIVLASADNSEKVISVTGLGTANNDSLSAALVLRNGVTLIIEKNVAIQQDAASFNSSTLRKGALIEVNDGGKLILDGGEIRNSRSDGEKASGVSMWNSDDLPNGGQAYFIMNSGKVTGNIKNFTTNNAAAGGIVLQGKSYFVMHGGEVSNNTLNYQNPQTNAYLSAGGIAGMGSAIQSSQGPASGRNNLYAVYITGGTITGNTFAGTGTSNPGASAGGIFIHSTLQKTGGVIKDNTNSHNSTPAAHRRNNVAVYWGTDGSAGQYWFRDAAAEETVMLFTNGIRGSSSNATDAVASGTVTKPAFAPDNWGK